MAEKHLPLVGYIVSHKFRNLYELYDPDELFASGSVGLWKAIKAFDPSKGFKFATFASRCIENEIFMFHRKQGKELTYYSLDTQIADVASETNRDKEHRGDSFQVLVGIDGHEDSVIDGMMVDRILQFMKELKVRLTNREYEVLMMDISGKKQRNIAKVLDLSQSYVSRILMRARKKAKFHFNRFYEINMKGGA